MKHDLFDEAAIDVLINARDTKGHSGLSLAIKEKEWEVVETLFKHPKTKDLIRNDDLQAIFRLLVVHRNGKPFQWIYSNFLSIHKMESNF